VNVATLVDEAVAAIHALPEKTAAPMRAVRVALSKKLKGGTPEEIFDAAQRLKSAGLDWMGWELIYANKPALKAIDIAMVEALGQGMASWQQTDGFGMILVGPAWLNGRIADDDVRRWARSTDIWWRRAALVATTGLNNRSRGGRGDAKRTLEIVEMLLDDREDMIVKAVSWALRMLAPWEPEAVRAFMDKHGERVPARARREVRNKLTTGYKNPKTR
jgi:3-methyladenine DNA glycosylase AlkD